MADALARTQKVRSPVLDKYRSRLMLTYRTNIDGTPVPARLPFRVLVLGQFTGTKIRDLRMAGDLSSRKVYSISPSQPSSSPNDHLASMLPWFPLESFVGPTGRASMTARVGGALTLGNIDVRINGEIPQSGATFDFETTGTFASLENNDHLCEISGGGLRVTGKITIAPNDAAAPAVGYDPLKHKISELKLSVAGVVVGQLLDPNLNRALSKLVVYLDAKSTVFAYATSAAPGAAPGAKLTAATDLATIVSAGEAGKTADEQAVRFTVKSDFTLRTFGQRALPLTSMASFAPDEVVDAVPELTRLRVIRGLVLDLQSTIRNNPAVRDALRTIVPAQRSLLVNFQKWAMRQFPLLKIEFVPSAASELDEASYASVAVDPTKVPELVASLSKVDDTALLDEPTLVAINTVLSPLGDSFATMLAAVIKHNEDLSLVAQSKTRSYVFHHRDADLSDAQRLVNSLAALLVNLPDMSVNPTPLSSFFNLYQQITDVVKKSDDSLQSSLDVILHNGDFKALEANWRGVAELADAVNADDVIIDLLDVTKTELEHDLEDNHLDIFGSALFHKLYIEEYDRYGGHPFATMIGLYEFDASDKDIKWLAVMKDVCAAAHCPFVAAVKPEFFLGRKSFENVAEIADLDAIMNHPKMAKWSALRDDDFAAYIGLTLPRYIQRRPWVAGDNDSDNQVGYNETMTRTLDDQRTKELVRENFCWGSAAIPFAKNIVRSYERSGWAQHIRGPIGGGMVEGLTAWSYVREDGSELMVNPVEIAVPDFREYQFARNGLISLVQKKGEATATFFSAQSIKRPKDFIEDLATKNAYLVTNLAYTFSITMIAHYVKAMMRQYIGSTADADYIQNSLTAWLSRFVTTVVNPDDLTLLYYPFKATNVSVEPKPGPFGWYRTVISVLPHAQFEGMDVELRLEAGLGGKS
ncbi:MAG: type VI secretion system contractile sheath large subunit [Deltaproteobacteria bacterium]|nr:type VI secretion system contractile sheath large subunit [Deltaproteobacteria bacterium]